MVGIAGGVPTRHDIRLGDVVVSSPGYGNGGVVQYDYGHAVQDKTFKITGHLNQPPAAILTAINGLRAMHERRGHSIEGAIDGILERNKRLRKKYRRPDPSSDKLYKPAFVHAGGEDTICSEVCSDGVRRRRSEPCPPARATRGGRYPGYSLWFDRIGKYADEGRLAP